MRFLQTLTILQIVFTLFVLSLTSACSSADSYDNIYSGTGSSVGDEARFMFTNVETAD